MKSDRVFTPAAIKSLIAAGDLIVIVDQNVLRLNGWINKHPGGRLAVLHMVGRDATDEVNIYHTYKTLRTMKAYSVGRIDEPWVNMTPPIRGGTFSMVKVPGYDASVPLPTHECPDDVSTTPLPSTASVASLEGSDTLTSATSPSQSPHLPRDAKHAQGCEKARSVQDSEEKQTYPSADDHTSRAIQDEIDQGLREYPSLDPETQGNILLKYKALHERVKDEGFYQCRYSEYGKEMVRYSILFACFLAAVKYEWYMTGAVFLGLFWHQIMFVAHDSAHRGITHNFVVDTLISIFIGDFCCGLSIGWWKSSHNVHHLVTNQPEHDPDIQNVPLFSTCPAYFKSVRSTYYDFTFAWNAFADVAIKYQVYTYYPVMALARFNLYFLSIGHLVSPRGERRGSAAWIRPTEVAAMVCYWYLFGYLLLWRALPTWGIRVAFVLVSHIATMPLHVQITLSHWGMPTSDLGEAESFPQRQLRTTMDVSCPPWLDFIHGGLQFQACHHLFPMVPRHNLRRLQVLVRDFCEDTGIPYKILGFGDGTKQVFGRLEHISRQAEFLVKCQRYMIQQRLTGLH